MVYVIMKYEGKKMELKEYICDDLLLIVPRNCKEKVIKTVSSLSFFHNYKIMDEVQLKEALYYSYDMKAIHYLVKNYHFKPENAIQYLENMYFVNEKETYQSKKLEAIQTIKKELMQNHLLKENKFFKASLEGKKILVYGFDVISKELLQILNAMQHEYHIIDFKESEKRVKTIYHFERLEDEVEAICIEISSLLQKNVDINKIKIANVNQDYFFTLKRYFEMYHLPVNLSENVALYDLLYIKEFLVSCENNQDYNKALKEFLLNYPNERDVYSLLLKLIEQILFLPFNESIKLFKYLLKNTTRPTQLLKNAVEIIQLDHYNTKEDEYIFVMSVNQGIYPSTFKDEDFLNDKEKDEINLDTSDDLNLLSKEKFHRLLMKNANIQLSYKDKSPFSSFTKSFVLIEEDVVDKKYIKNSSISYSVLADKLLLARKYDSIYQKTNDEEVAILANTYKIDYKKYNHAFLPFNSEKIRELIFAKKKKISYSSINNYFACSFKFYLANLLDLNKDISSRSIDIGNVFHKVLELSKENDFDFEKVYEEQCKNIEDKVTLFYLNKFKSMLKDIIQINQENLKNSALNQILTEKQVFVEYTEPFNILFKGYIDKILYTIQDDKTYVAIIDYKTSNPEIDVNKVKYGLSLQLPIYLYLIKHTNEFKNVEVCGFYLQKLLPKQWKADQDYFQTLKDTIAYQGYSNASKAILSLFDPHYENSTMIKSMKTNKDGSFYRFAKVLTSEEMDEIANLVEEKIKEAIKGINRCEFDINPKILNGKNQSCKFCEFKECCFVTHDDFIYLDENDVEMEGDFNGN